MNEYINYGALSVVIFISLALIATEFNNKKKSTTTYIILVIMISLLLFDAYDTQETTLKNISDFKNNAILKCESGGGLYSSANTFRVSKQDGWVVDNNHFIKESFMIHAKGCERWWCEQNV